MLEKFYKKVAIATQKKKLKRFENYNVQRTLLQRENENAHLVAKEKYREELPLRGHLKCPDCGRNLTGSLSS